VPGFTQNMFPVACLQTIIQGMNYLPADTKSIVRTHTLCTTQIVENVQNNQPQHWFEDVSII